MPRLSRRHISIAAAVLVTFFLYHSYTTIPHQNLAPVSPIPPIPPIPNVKSLVQSDKPAEDVHPAQDAKPAEQGKPFDPNVLGPSLPATPDLQHSSTGTSEEVVLDSESSDDGVAGVTTPLPSPAWAGRKPRYPVGGEMQVLPTGEPKAIPNIQYDFGTESSTAKQVRQPRLAAVKEAMKHSWQGYRKYAWLQDELAPLSKGAHEAFGNWSATLVDSLDTLWIMDLKDEFDEAADAVATIDFETSTTQVISVFETTIRYLGGLLAAYDLSGKEVLLKKALELGNMLYAAFDTPNRMPVPYWDWKVAALNGDQIAINREISADVGSLTLEFTRLTQLTGDQKFFDAVQRITDIFAKEQSKSSIPGLWPIFVNTRDGDMHTGSDYSFGAMADSLYEYLPKMHLLVGGLLPMYEKMYTMAIEAAQTTLFYRPMTKDNRDILISSGASGSEDKFRLDGSAQHLSCFVGGMVGIGAKIFSRPKEISMASKLADGCYWAYENSPAGIMPEIMSAFPCKDPQNCPWDEEAWHKSIQGSVHVSPNKDIAEAAKKRGLSPGVVSIGDGKYILRPEAIESIFIMYRITGDSAWQDKAWDMFSAVEKATRAETGYASLEDVSKPQPVQVDKMESFWTAETLKYFYLVFAEPDLISLDDYVFNTEAHPFKRPKGKVSGELSRSDKGAVKEKEDEEKESTEEGESTVTGSEGIQQDRPAAKQQVDLGTDAGVKLGQG